jgi:RHS repeat-associated protein
MYRDMTVTVGKIISVIAASVDQIRFRSQRALCLRSIALFAVPIVTFGLSNQAIAQQQCYEYSPLYLGVDTWFPDPYSACNALAARFEVPGINTTPPNTTSATGVVVPPIAGIISAPNWLCAITYTVTGPTFDQWGNPTGTKTSAPQSAGLSGIDALPQSGCSPQYFLTATTPPLAQTSSPDPLGEPINPAIGNVYTTETDVTFAGSGEIAFQRFYNSADATGTDGVPGWRHSYDRSIDTDYQSVSTPYPGQSTVVSPEYSTPALACTSGFAAIQGAVSAWSGATASYNNGVCMIANGATLPIQSDPGLLPPAGPIEYDLIRDDGQTLRYTLQNGVLNNPPGVSIRLAATGSGFTVTDDEDNVEVYNSVGVLQSITSRAGVVQTLSYDTNGRLIGVTDSFGNSLTVTRDGFGRVGSITGGGGSSAQYSYDADWRLSTVTNLDGTTRSYVYGNATFPNALTSVVDENGTTLSSWVYDSQERATSSTLAVGANATTLVYNADGSVRTTDALGTVRTFTYTRSGDINQVASISGSQCPTCRDSAATNYDSYGWVASRTDYNGNLTCYANDPTRGLELVRVEGFAPGSSCPTYLASYTPAAGTLQRMITTQWSTSWREPVLITEPNRTISFTYDGSGNALTKTVTDTTVSPNGSRTWTYTYTSDGQVLTAKGPRTDVNSTTTYAYYTCATGTQCGQVQTITNAVGQVTTLNTYNAYGQPLTITDPNGVVTTLTYDARERITSSQVGTETTGYTYYPTGLLKQVTVPDGSTILLTYDGAHRLTKITDGVGNYINYTLDAMGNHTAENSYDPSGALHRTHTRVFNTLNELYQDINAAGTAAVTITFGYDSNGNRTAIDAPLSRNTGNKYDALNRLTQITDPNGGVTQLGYDANDNLFSVNDSRSLTTTYIHNGFGNVVQQVSPDTGTTTKAYDSGGNLKTATDARGAVATYSYDALNRMTQVAYTDQTINFTYDAGTNGAGRLTRASDANHMLSWAYDALGRVIGKGQTVGALTLGVGYAYTNGDLVSIVTPSGQTITYSYTNHQITAINVNGAALLSSVTYEPFGSVNGWTWGNSTSVSRTYDTDEKITQINTAADTISFGYDNAFRITGITDSGISANSWTLGYDALDRLTAATKTGTTRGWTYDANGNRLSQTGSNASTFTPSTTSNQLNSTAGALGRTYGYDAAGNTTSYASDAFTFNQRGRMSAASVSNSTTNYLYSALGQLIEKYGAGGTTLLMYDESGHLLGEYTNSGALIQETVWMGDVPVATLRPNGTSPVSIYYVHTDQLNAPRVITQPSGNAIAWRWDTDPFGTVAPNQNPSGLGTFIYNLRFPGQYYQAETGVNYNFFRDYDPSVGRYIESDPIGLRGGINPYAYVGGNPLSRFDPRGMCMNGLSAAETAESEATVALSNNPTLATIAAIAPLAVLALPDLAAAEVAESLVTVSHFTSVEGAAAISETGTLNAGSFVTTSDLSGLSASEVESALEIQAGRGATSTTFQTPASNLGPAYNGPLTSGGAPQFQLANPTPVPPFIPTP